jgi:hypothetical protein
MKLNKSSVSVKLRGAIAPGIRIMTYDVAFTQQEERIAEHDD